MFASLLTPIAETLHKDLNHMKEMGGVVYFSRIYFNIG